MQITNLNFITRSIKFVSCNSNNGHVLFTGKTFMEIEQTRALDGLTLFGNAGGYLGLFLGCALMQLPDVLLFFYNWIRSIANCNY